MKIVSRFHELIASRMKVVFMRLPIGGRSCCSRAKQYSYSRPTYGLPVAGRGLYATEVADKLGPRNSK